MELIARLELGAKAAALVAGCRRRFEAAREDGVEPVSVDMGQRAYWILCMSMGAGPWAMLAEGEDREPGQAVPMICGVPIFCDSLLESEMVQIHGVES